MIGWATAILTGGPARKALGLLLAAATVALFLINLRRAGEHVGRAAERFDARERNDAIHRQMLDAASRHRHWLERIPSTRLFQISAANIGPNRFHQKGTVSWLKSMPLSCNRSSTLRNDSGNRTYSISARRMISGLDLKDLKDERFVIPQGYEIALPGSS